MVLKDISAAQQAPPIDLVFRDLKVKKAKAYCNFIFGSSSNKAFWAAIDVISSTLLTFTSSFSLRYDPK